MRKLPLIIVEWDDITTDTGWGYDDEDKSSEHLGCISVGWKVKSNRRFLQITPMRSHWHGSKYSKCSDRQIIPRGCIKSIRRLE